MIRCAQDASRAGLFLEVTCTRCGRTGVFDPAAFTGTRLGTISLERLAGRMRCEGPINGPAGCGQRGATIRCMTWPPAHPVHDPRPVAHTDAPYGIDPAARNAADDQGRRRLIKGARG